MAHRRRRHTPAQAVPSSESGHKKEIGALRRRLAKQQAGKHVRRLSTISRHWLDFATACRPCDASN